MNSDALAARIQDKLGSVEGHDPQRILPACFVPDHELICRIGGGSYGEVWLARSITGRFHAVKVVWREKFTSDRPYEREFRGIVQFEAISRLHPGVVNVLHVGRDDKAQCFFYVMELADPSGAEAPAGVPDSRTGQVPSNYKPRTLASDLKKRGRLQVSEVLTLGVQLADALGHLHRSGLVHRDVKPSNVIFVNGHAKLADPGLVAGSEESRSFVGTEGYIPPEGPGTTRADLFALGRVLYQAVTGKDRSEFPELPDDLDRWPDHLAVIELNEIIARACAPDPKRRHANAAELAGDLNLLLSGRSIRSAYGSERRLKRASQVLALAAVVLVFFLGALSLKETQRVRASARVAREELLRRRAEEAEQSSQERLRESLLQQSVALTRSSEPDRRARAIAALRGAAQIRRGSDLRNAAIAAFATPELRVIRRWKPSYPDARSIRPDTTLSRYAAALLDGTVAIARMSDDGEEFRLPSPGGPADFGVFSPDGGWLAVKYSDASVHAWNLTARTNFPLRMKVENQAFEFSPDSSALVIASRNNRLRLVDLRSGQDRWNVLAPPLRDALAFHPTEPLIAALSVGASTLDVYRVADGSLERKIAVPRLGFMAFWSTDGRQLITTHDDYSIRAWDWNALESPRVIIRFHRSEPSYLALDPSGRWLASAGWDTQLYWTDTLDGRMILNRPGNSVHSSSQGTTFLWRDKESSTLVHFEPALFLQTIPVHERGKSPACLAFSRDGKWLATGGIDGIRLIHLETQAITPVPGGRRTHALSFGTNNNSLYAATPDGLFAWEVLPINGSPHPQFIPMSLGSSLPHSEILGASFDPGGASWAALQLDERMNQFVWRHAVVGDSNFQTIAHETPGMNGPAVSKDARWLAWGNWLGRDAFVVQLGTNSSPIRLSDDRSVTVAFSPDNRLLAVGGETEIRFYETESWRLVQTVRRASPGFRPNIQFASNSRICAVALPPNQLQLMDVQTGAELALLQSHENHMLGRVTFSPDDRFLAAVSGDHNVLVWNLTELREKLRELQLDW